jgi:hypothetical protein
MPLDVLGHLIHQVQLQRPKELGVMMSDVSLYRFEKLFLRTACELRPALAFGDPPAAFVDRGYSALVNAVQLHFACPTENAVSCYPGVHAQEKTTSTLSIRFQNVAAVRTRH